MNFLALNYVLRRFILLHSLMPIIDGLLQPFFSWPKKDPTPSSLMSPLKTGPGPTSRFLISPFGFALVVRIFFVVSLHPFGASGVRKIEFPKMPTD